MGNIIGSAISNILGAFSLGLLFHRSSEETLFDRSSKIYSLLLLLLTILIAGLTGFGHHGMWRIVGGVMIVIFGIYVGSIAWTISKGGIIAPELSDDSSDDGSDDTTRELLNGDTERADTIVQSLTYGTISGPRDGDVSRTSNMNADQQPVTVTQVRSLNRDTQSSETPQEPASPSWHHYPDPTDSSDPNLLYHVAFLVFGFLALVLSSHVLSHAASTLVDEFAISDVLFGVVILSIATTIPEKFVAVLSGFRGQPGIMVANTVGSNIFLLSLCMGILWVSTGGAFDQGSVNATEVGVMLGSTVAMTLTVWFGARWIRWIGSVMLVAYIVFLILEFTLIRSVW